MNKLKITYRYFLSCVALVLCFANGFSQTTLVNFDFNAGTSYSSLSPSLATNITSSVTSTETWQTYTGISSGTNAFTTNSTAGNALAMTNSSGTNTRYFQFQLGGAALPNYSTYKLYLQSQRSSTGGSTITLAYSTNGTTFTNFTTTQLPGNGAFSENTFDLSAITAINSQSTIYFRILASGASSTGTLRIDNFQITATPCVTPTLSVTASSQTICAGSSTTLAASGATSYTWNPGGITTATASISPSTTTVYTVTGNNGTCISTKSITITVNPIPTISVTASSQTICAGSSTNLTASGAASYTWNPGGVTSATASVNPSATTIYTVTGNNGSCTSTKTIAIAVNPIPSISITASSQTICAGSSTTLTASGASSYTWNPSSITTSSAAVSPSTTTTYTVTGNSLGCISTKSIILTVNTIPTITISNSSPSITIGNSSTLTASGATNYTWSTGATTSNILVSPNTTTIYTVTGNNLGCVNAQTSTVVVNTGSGAVLVNYDFNTGTSYSTLNPVLATNITSSATSTEAWQTYTGISNGINAFATNSTAGNALAMANSSGTNTRYFQFQLGGSALSNYSSYKLYLQSQRSSTGASTITLAYSTDGTTFTNYATTQLSGNGSFSENTFDLSAITAINSKSTIYFRMFASGASGVGTLRIDNVQVFANLTPCSSPTKLFFASQPSSTAQGTTLTTFSVATTCTNNITAVGCNNGSVTIIYSGTGSSGTFTKPVLNGIATFDDIVINGYGQTGSFTASYSGSCGTFSAIASSTFVISGLKDENFDGSPAPWPYIVGSPTTIGSGGSTGTDVVGLSNIGTSGNSLIKSYSVDNASGEIGTSNTITFSNVNGLNSYSNVKFSFQIASLGSGTGSGADNGEYLSIETSLDGGVSWNNLLKNNGYSDHLFPLSPSSPATLPYNANITYSNGNALWNQSAFIVNLPSGTNQFQFRMTASNNRTNENWAIDNIKLEAINKLSVVTTIQDYISDSLKGTVNLTITGGTPPYNVAWNGNKLPPSSLVYNQLTTTYPSLVVDSIKFKHQIDSLKQLTSYTNLLPGTYSVTVYDQNNDSALSIISIGMPVNNWAYLYGATTTTCLTTPLTLNNVIYNYGVGQCITQQGTYSAGNNFAIPLQPFDFNSASSSSFMIPNANDVVYVGIQEKQAEVNGGYADINQKTMFRFNGNSTYDVIFNAAVIYSGIFVSNDRFAFRIDPVTGNIAYYKNETLLTQVSFSAINTSVIDYVTKVVLGNSNARVSGLRIISPSIFTPSITGIITDVTCDNICSGSIKTTGYYPLVNTPDKYEIYKSSNLVTPLQTISAAGVSNVTFNNLCPGSYTIKYHVNVLNFHIIIGGIPFPLITLIPVTIQQNFLVGYKPNWTNITSNITVASTDNSLTKTGPSNAFDAGASSFNTLLSSSTNTEWMEWTASGFNILGLSANDPDVNFSTIGYGILNLDLFGYHLYGVLHNGSFVSGIGLGAAADKFRIEKNGSGLVLKRNTSIITTISGISPNPDVIADASMFFINGSLSHPRLSFGCNLPKVYAVLKKELDGTYFQTYNNNLLFTTDGDYSNTGINYSIYDYARTSYSAFPINSTALKNGDNRYSIDISALASGYYVLELLNQKKEKLVLRFKK